MGNSGKKRGSTKKNKKRTKVTKKSTVKKIKDGIFITRIL